MLENNMKFVPVAVHLITESADHYTYLLRIINVEDFISELTKVFDQFDCVSDHYIETNNNQFNKELSEALQAEIDSRWVE